MPEPIVDQIVEQMKTVLETITTANGYWQDVTVERPKVDGNDPKNNMLVVHPLGKTRLDEFNPPMFEPGHMIRWSLSVVIEGIIQEAKDSGTTIDTRVHRLISDIEKALMLDLNLNDLADATVLVSSDNFLIDKPAGLAVFVDVHYTTNRFDPYSK